MATCQVCKQPSLRRSLETQVTLCTSQEEKLSTLFPPLSLLFVHFCFIDEMAAMKAEVRTTKARTCSHVHQARQARPSCTLPIKLGPGCKLTTCLDTGTSKAPAHALRRFLPLRGQATKCPCWLRCFARGALLLPAEADTLSSR